MRQKKHPVRGKPKGLPKGAPYGFLNFAPKPINIGDPDVRYIENDYFPEDYFGTDYR